MPVDAVGSASLREAGPGRRSRPRSVGAVISSSPQAAGRAGSAGRGGASRSRCRRRCPPRRPRRPWRPRRRPTPPPWTCSHPSWWKWTVDLRGVADAGDAVVLEVGGQHGPRHRVDVALLVERVADALDDAALALAAGQPLGVMRPTAMPPSTRSGRTVPRRVSTSTSVTWTAPMKPRPMRHAAHRDRGRRSRAGRAGACRRPWRRRSGPAPAGVVRRRVRREPPRWSCGCRWTPARARCPSFRSRPGRARRAGPSSSRRISAMTLRMPVPMSWVVVRATTTSPSTEARPPVPGSSM